MDESGQLCSAPAAAFPRMMSREMPQHNGVIYHMTSLENEGFSPHYGGSVNAGSTFLVQSSALPCTVSRVVMTSSHAAKLNSSVAATIQSGSVGCKQLPDEVALSSQSSAVHCVDTCSSSVTSHTASFTTQHLCTDTVLSASITCSPVTQQLTQTSSTVSTVCAQPMSSYSVQYSQQRAPGNADEKVLPCSEVNSLGSHYSSVKDGIMLNKQFDTMDDKTSAVKVEPKIEMETENSEVSESSVCHLPVTSVKVEVKSDQLKHEIKSELASEESLDSKDHLSLKHTDAAVADEPACDADVKKESTRKGTYCLLSKFLCMVVHSRRVKVMISEYVYFIVHI